jgi:hypothetical protein
VWAKSFKGSQANYGTSIAADTLGNVYTAGKFNGTVNFSTGAESNLFTSSRTGQFDYDFYLSKLDSNGNVLWVKSLGYYSSGRTCKISVDEAGNVYTAGTFGDSLNSIRKYSTDGNLVWSKKIRSANRFEQYAIDTDNSGSVYVAGTFNGTGDFDPGLDSFKLTSNSGSPSYVLKLDKDGNFVFAKKFGGYVYAIDVDDFNNIHAFGLFLNSSQDFNPDDNVQFNLPCSGRDFFLLKLDDAGNFLWAGGLTNNNELLVASVKTDSQSNVYIAGTFRGTIDLDPGSGYSVKSSKGSQDMVFAKYNSAGNLIWGNIIGSTGQDFVNYLSLDNSNNIYLTGGFSKTVDFDPSAAAAFNLTAVSADIFVVKLSEEVITGTETEQTDFTRIYPNPASGNVLMISSEKADDNYTILDLQGRIVAEGKTKQRITEVDITDLGQGVYYLKSDGGRKVTKIVRQ